MSDRTDKEDRGRSGLSDSLSPSEDSCLLKSPPPILELIEISQPDASASVRSERLVAASIAS